jgi:hypothetical protein
MRLGAGGGVAMVCCRRCVQHAGVSHWMDKAPARGPLAVSRQSAPNRHRLAPVCHHPQSEGEAEPAPPLLAAQQHPGGGKTWRVAPPAVTPLLLASRPGNEVAGPSGSALAGGLFAFGLPAVPRSDLERAAAVAHLARSRARMHKVGAQESAQR